MYQIVCMMQSAQRPEVHPPLTYNTGSQPKGWNPCNGLWDESERMPDEKNARHIKLGLFSDLLCILFMVNYDLTHLFILNWSQTVTYAASDE